MSAFVPIAPLRIQHHAIRLPLCRTTRTVPRASASTEKRPKVTPVRVASAAAFGVYLPLVFGFSVGAEPGTPAHTLYALREAVDLSLNFGYITPVVFPNLAPHIHPALEAIFNFVVAWAALLFGFLSEDTDEKSPPYRPFAYAILFLTNIFYLPYLVLREQRTDGGGPKTTTSASDTRVSGDLRFAESATLPQLVLALAATSAAWFAFGRPEFGAERLQELTHLWNTDVLAHSFIIDMVAFTGFQGALVPDDAKRRNWQGDERDNAVRAAQFIPFFGLVYYLWKRAECAPLSILAADFVDFKSLKLGPKPNQYLVAPPGHCLQAQPQVTCSIFEYPAKELYLKVCDYSNNWNQVKVDDDAMRVKAVAITPLMRYMDDIDIQVIDAGENKSTLAVYSRSRVGYGDMGANQNRVQQMLSELCVDGESKLE